MADRRIGISLVDFTPGKMGGVETYVRNLIEQLVVSDDSFRYTLICYDGNVDYFGHLHDRVDTRVFRHKKNSPHRLARSLVRKISGIDLIQTSVDRLGLDLLHNPFTALRSSRYQTPTVVTFHDLQHRYFPQFFTAREVEGRDCLYRKTAHEAGHLIAVSDFTRQTICNDYGIPLDKVTVVPLGVGAEYRRYGEGDVVAVREQLRLSRPFMYFPAATWPHKNHSRLFAALKLLVERYGFDGDLVLTGVATRSHDLLKGEIASLGLAERVHILGYLPYETLPLIYNMAHLMVFPSLFEGFGMPVLEAMACGCPVVCSEVSSLPEVAGTAARYFDPLSVESMAQAILSVWGSNELQMELCCLGHDRAAYFTWENTAEQTLEVYRALAS